MSAPRKEPNPVPADWGAWLPFDLESGDPDLIAKALRAFKYETAEEEANGMFLAEQFEKMN
ncbi:MAG: hypothetical protein KGL35_25145 [Bradyrhizobium sp.]|nr:hypothetical protein [Bradyrhizobium sp.]